MSITELSQDAETVQRQIKETWGFTPTLAYCEALIRFIAQMEGNHA